jgi:hypothetical protein
MEELGSQDLTIVAAVVFLALVAFIAVLYLNRKSSGKPGGARTPNVKSSIPEGETGTVFVEGDGGKVVRRSTRQHKPVTPLVRAWGSLLIVEFFELLAGLLRCRPCLAAASHLGSLAT